MDLTVSEAATLLGVPARTLRGQLSRGDIPGRRKGGRWVVAAQDLPLNEAQRRRLQAKADSIRATVEDALPSRLAPTQGRKGRSVADCDVYRAMRPVYDGVASSAATDPRLCPAADELRQALLGVAEAVCHFDADLKRGALIRARGALGRAVGHLLLASPDPPTDPALTWLNTLEGKALPTLAGLLRWSERLGRRPR